MALKEKITNKEEFEALHEVLRAEYTEKNGSYYLGTESSGEQSRALEREKQEKKEAKKLAKELQEKLDALDHTEAIKSGDLNTLTKSYEEKIRLKEEALSSEIKKYQNIAVQGLLDSAIGNVLNKDGKPLFTVPHLVAKEVRDRLTVDFSGDAPVIKVLDSSKQISAFNLEDLQKEILENKSYSPILIESKASGSAGSFNTKNHGSAVSNGSKTFSQMSPEEQKAHIEANYTIGR